MTEAPARPPAVILAGGLSRRMGGGDKPLLALGARPILSHVIARLAPQAGPLVLNANGDPARFAAFGLPVISDTVADHPGPLAGILAGLEWAAQAGHPAIVSAAGDTPFLPHDLVARLAAAAGRTGIAIAATEEDGALRHHPTFGLWRVACRVRLAEALAGGLRRVRAFAEAEGAGVALFPDPAAFFNINTPADRDAAAAALPAAGVSDPS